MTPVIVRYTRATPAPVALPGVAVVRRPETTIQFVAKLERLRQQINDGEVHEVVIVGPGAVTGWRIHVARPVVFHHQVAEWAAFEVEQTQASARIMQSGNRVSFKAVEFSG